MKETKYFEYPLNIGFKEIEDFCNFYYEEKNNKLTTKKFGVVKFSFSDYKSDVVDSSLAKQVDSVFISYLILYLQEFKNKKIVFDFKNNKNQDRAFSLQNQLLFVCHLYENSLKIFDNKRIEIKGVKGASLYTYEELVNKDTGELKLVNLGFKPITQSQSFIPHLLISDEVNYSFFGEISDDDIVLKKMYDNYKQKIIDEIPKRISSRKNWDKQNSIINSLDLDSLSFVELTIFRLLLSQDTYQNLEGNDKDRSLIYTQHKKRIEKYVDFVKSISLGLHELSKNIVQHAKPSKAGVISVRLYEYKQISSLKGNKTLNKFLDIRNTLDYKLKKTRKAKEEELRFFLDVNIIDFGEKSIRETYTENIKINIDQIKLFSDEDFSTDIKLIDSKGFNYKDFFVIDIENFSKIRHQQNKLISRIGLHYFTNILKDLHSAYIKTSSNSIKRINKGFNDGVIIYNNSNNEVIGETNDIDFLKYGTTYNCIIPIKVRNFREEKIYHFNDNKISSTKINTFKELNKYEIINYSENPKKAEYSIFRYQENLPRKTKPEEKYHNIFKVFKDIKSKCIKNNENIILIDASNINLSIILNEKEAHNKSESDWIRLLSALNYYFKDIIVYNISLLELTRLLDIRKSWSKSNLDFWNNDSRVLFFSKKESYDNEFLRYGATLVTGKKIKDFNIINSNIWNHHYSHKKIFKLIKNPNKNINSLDLGTNLFNNRNLKYFEVLIPFKAVNEGSEMSLFEKSIQYSLNTDFKENQINNTNNRGYKISNTHFKLGSKIHVEDYFYARKLFQNSFFTIPLAYSLSKNIIPEIKKISGKITLVGYETYSSFLLSTTRNIIIKSGFDAKNINHCTIDKNGVLSRERKKLNQNIIIIIPIASTFSTSIKIKNQLTGIYNREQKEKEKEKQNKEGVSQYNINTPIFINPFFNVIVVGHKDSELQFDKNDSRIDGKGFQKININVLEEQNWNSINIKNKIININVLKEQNWGSINTKDKIINSVSDKKFIQQKYLIPLYTKWYNANNCEKCFTQLSKNNKKIDSEKILIQTGESSITPKLIFNMPKTKKAYKVLIKEKGVEFRENNEKLDLTKSLLYGNLKKRDNRYLYYTRIGKILNNEFNKLKVINWLKSEVKALFKEPNKKVVLVTPASGSRSNFIDLVNEFVFEYTANCLIVSIQEDYIENVETLYADGLNNADLIIYVDDVLSTIESFTITNYIIKYIRNKRKTGKGINYCISLINRMSYDNEENLLLKLCDLSSNNVFADLNSAESKLIYFSKINNPTIQEPNNDFPLEKEKNRYLKLSRTSSLDAIREHFINKYNDLIPSDLSISIPNKIKDYDENKSSKRKDKKLFQLLVLNSIYTIFEYDYSTTKEICIREREERFNLFFSENISSLEKELIHYVSKQLENEAINNSLKEIIEKFTPNLDYVILKIICSTPLVYYQKIRKAAFSWIIIKLEKIRVNNLLVIRKEVSDLNSKIELYNKKVIEVEKLILDNKDVNNKKLKDRKEEIQKLATEIRELLSSSSFKDFFAKGPESKSENGYTKFQSFKFLLKRSVELNSNFIIHLDFFESIKNLIQLLYEDKKKISRIIEFNDLIKGELFYQSFNIPSVKSIIYDLVVLFQELLFNHENKSFLLEQNINEYISKDRKNFSKNLNNGDFNHFLRLLKVENIETIEKFWYYFVNNEKHIAENASSKILKETIKKYIFLSKDTPKVVSKDFKLKPILSNSLIQYSQLEYYIELRHFLSFKIMDKPIEDIFINILKLTSGILNVNEDIVHDAYFTVNYKNSQTRLSPNDLLVFDKYKPNNNPIGKDQLEKVNSINWKLFKRLESDTSDKKQTYTLSNLELIKEKGSKISLRENILSENELNELIEKSPEIDYAEKKLNEQYNILFLVISDFNSYDNLIYTQAVITYFIKKGTRIKEETLRILMSLRTPISKFIKSKDITTYLSKYEREVERKQINKTRHYLGKYYQKLRGLYLNNNNLISLDEQKVLFDIILNAIQTQTSSVNEEHLTKNRVISFEVLRNHILLILRGIGHVNESNFEILNNSETFNNSYDLFKIPKILFDSIITQVVINMTQYYLDIEFKKEKSISIIFKVCKEEKNIHISFSNVIDGVKVEQSQSSKQGIELCMDLVKKINKVNLPFKDLIINFPTEDVTPYVVKIKFPFYN